YRGARAGGLLLNVRMVNATFEDANEQTRPKDFDADANTDAFIARIPEYVAQGVRAFTLCLQGGSCGYEGAVNSAFEPGGSLRESYLRRVARVIEACDRHGAAVILGLYYQRQSKMLRDEAAVRAGVVNAARWIQAGGFQNVLLEVANEYPHKGFAHPVIRDAKGQASLIRLAKETAPGLLVTASGYGDGLIHPEVAEAADFLAPHWNGTKVELIPTRVAALERFGKAIVVNEDAKVGERGVAALKASVTSGASWGLMLVKRNQHVPFTFGGAADDPAVYAVFKELTTPAPRAAAGAADFFPPSDTQGGWRALKSAEEIRRVAGMDEAKLDAAFVFIQGSTKNGGLLVVRRGWLVLERYFGKGHREATPNLASCGKSFTSIAAGILMAKRPELFPDGLDQKIFTPRYFPPEAFPLSDPRKKDIKLGQLLAFTAGIRGNNPSYVNGKETTIDPVGPDGWQAKVEAIALGKQDGVFGKTPFSTATLWCNPGEGYSYASSSIHLASIMLRHVTGMELQEYVDKHLAKPLGWGRWGYGYKHVPQVKHTPGGGGIALRATDMLRFGYLLLREGRWNGQQLVPAEYVRLCARRSPYNPHFPYILQFNVNTDGDLPELPRDAFWKSGSGGHALYVVPSLDLVVWKLGGRDEQYSPDNTGLPPSPAPPEQVAARKGWKETVNKESALRTTLEMVIKAIEP
ncbi:MAG: beta-lactamase family protein, partial [Verrucomicrobiota bacterium]|nr:beta-lactamase family protein [Verrucomicrobiota bacterium]